MEYLFRSTNDAKINQPFLFWSTTVLISFLANTENHSQRLQLVVLDVRLDMGFGVRTEYWLVDSCFFFLWKVGHLPNGLMFCFWPFPPFTNANWVGAGQDFGKWGCHHLKMTAPISWPHRIWRKCKPWYPMVLIEPFIILKY